MGLGFSAGGETVRVENGDGGGDGDSLRFYVAITLPQMPLSEIDGVVLVFINVSLVLSRHPMLFTILSIFY